MCLVAFLQPEGCKHSTFHNVHAQSVEPLWATGRSDLSCCGLCRAAAARNPFVVTKGDAIPSGERLIPTRCVRVWELGLALTFLYVLLIPQTQSDNLALHVCVHNYVMPYLEICMCHPAAADVEVPSFSSVRPVVQALCMLWIGFQSDNPAFHVCVYTPM